MRINNVDNVMKVYKKGLSNIKCNNRSDRKDRIEISDRGRDYQFAINKARELPEVRAEKVAKIKGQLEAGNYKIDSGKIADKILRKSDLIEKYDEW